MVLLVLFMSSWWVLEFCHTTATSCILTAWWRWRHMALMRTRLSMANEWLRQRCCVQAPHSSSALRMSLSLWTRCMTKGERRSQGPWWGADTSLGERERSLSAYIVAGLYFFSFSYYHPSLFSLSSPLLPLCSFSTHFQKCVHKKSVIVDKRETGWGLKLADRRRDEGKERESEVWGWSDGENGENEKRESGGALRLWQAGCSLNWWRRVWSSIHFNAPAEDRTAEQWIRELAATTCYRGFENS